MTMMSWNTIHSLSVAWTSMSLSLRCSLVANLVFWIASGIGLWADRRVEYEIQLELEEETRSHKDKHSSKEKPSWQFPCIKLKPYKIQPDIIITGSDRIDLIRLASFNMIVVGLGICGPLYEALWKYCQPHRLDTTTTMTDIDMDWKTEILKLPIHAFVAEVSFYVVHSLLHYSPFLYHRIHKIHHRFPAPTAMTCVYAHPLEFAVGSVLPIYLGPMLTNPHPYTCYVWWAAAMLGTCKGHSGYRIGGHIDDHEDHHKLYRYNYGGMGLLDRLLGTTPPSPSLSTTKTKTS